MLQSDALGTACHTVASASVLVYTVLAILYAKPESKFFDDAWVEHGFCVVNQNVPYWNSHDLCLYFDAVLVLLGGAVYLALRGTSGMKAADELMVFNLLGHLGHGIAHGFIAVDYRRGRGGVGQLTTLERFGELEGIAIARQLAIGLCFWLGLLKGVMPKFSNTIIFFAAVLVVIGGLFVREVLGFAYVQAVIAVAFAATQVSLPKKEKDFAYGAFAAVSIPISLIPWVESTACQTIASKFGGHLMYDVSIPVLLTAAYYASWRHYTSAGSKVKAS